MTNLDAFNLDRFNTFSPPELPAIRADAHAIGFSHSSYPGLGQLLRFLASTKPGGHFLEIGTGTGVGTCWLRSGMDAKARLVTVESDDSHAAVARKHLGHDPRIEFVTADGGAYLSQQQPSSFDLIFADAVPGKCHSVSETFQLLKPGGIYAVDDMFPQDDWPTDYYPEAEQMVNGLAALQGVISVGIAWSSGLVLMTAPAR
ncbi:MAG: class I SAM-dependent methyltransferase [Mycobacteriaceae bacterium]|nr:class I SAM-dependent methyltransferase [Mycobacteriaceae bacterium]